MSKACPKCAHELAAVAPGAYRCPSCAGMFVPSPVVPFIQEGDVPSPGESYDAQAGRCPLDGSILSRAEIDAGLQHTAIHLERCSSCRGIWFDRGEWSLLAEQQLLENLDEIWTAEWRTHQRRLRNERNYETRMREELGPDLYASLQAVAAQLKGHERRSQALAFLREASSD